jgi:hemerythrin-like domain-containing protein
VLASESAWRILMAEHARLREFLVAIDRATASCGWQRPGDELAALKRLLESLRAFDDATHRPKGVALFEALRSRLKDPAARGMLDVHEQQQVECSRLLDEAITLLDEIPRGRAAAAAQCAERLAQHRTLLRAHLAMEDTALRAAALEALTPEDWSAVVSSISSVVGRDGGQR